MRVGDETERYMTYREVESNSNELIRYYGGIEGLNKRQQNYADAQVEVSYHIIDAIEGKEPEDRISPYEYFKILKPFASRIAEAEDNMTLFDWRDLGLVPASNKAYEDTIPNSGNNSNASRGVRMTIDDFKRMEND